jgi:acetyl-CoA carboxylase biotin carboxylase subunit
MLTRVTPNSAPRLFRRLFIANRGEVAVRIARACDELGIVPVLGVSEADREAPYTRGRETVCLGPPHSAQSYLGVQNVVQAARQSGCTALHPGWGFLAEDPLLATLCAAHGIRFIGPPAHVMHRMGTKTLARKAMVGAGLALIPGSDGTLRDADEARTVAERIGFPVLLKANRGGGGRGMRIARSPDELAGAFDEAASEARAALADPRLYMERLIEGGRHVEIQIMADRYGNVRHLGERDCTIQRNHQKLIEEAPSPVLREDERARTVDAAVRAAASIGYVGAGTMEFLLDGDTLRFMEMNTRLQVEHSVTEMLTGIDLVVEQIRVAAGHPLSFEQHDVVLDGHAIECRINAEDPTNGFRPAPGMITHWRGPRVRNGAIRVDTHVEAGCPVSPHYDSLLCKVITWGRDRDVACDRMVEALEELVCEGVPTTVPMHLEILTSMDFRRHRYDTRVIPGWPPGRAA